MMKLYKPTLSDLWFRRELLSDPETMEYNHAWGCTIDFPEQRWAVWYRKWLDGDGRYFYRYLVNEAGDFVGEAAYHYVEDLRAYLCDVIVMAKFRGNGYGRQGLELLCQTAKENGLTELFDMIAADNPSINLFLSSGFTVVGEDRDSVVVRREL